MGVAIPRPDFGGVPAVEKTGLPFGASERPKETIVLHIKVLSPDPAERLAAARQIDIALAGQRLGSKSLTHIITDEAVTVELATTSALAAKITADVMARLGISQ